MANSTEAVPADAPVPAGQSQWNVYRRPNGNVSDNRTIIADNLAVEGGAAVFSVGGVVTWVFPPTEYLYVEKIR